MQGVELFRDPTQSSWNSHKYVGNPWNAHPDWSYEGSDGRQAFRRWQGVCVQLTSSYDNGIEKLAIRWKNVFQAEEDIVYKNKAFLIVVKINLEKIVRGWSTLVHTWSVRKESWFCIFSKIIYLFMNIYFAPFKVIPVRFYARVPTFFSILEALQKSFLLSCSAPPSMPSLSPQS